MRLLAVVVGRVATRLPALRQEAREACIQSTADCSPPYAGRYSTISPMRSHAVVLLVAGSMFSPPSA